MKIAFFGSSLVSSYWNGAATYYRGILKALAELGHDITFYEPDAFERQSHRDIADPPWARVVVYPATGQGWEGALGSARGTDVLVKASGVGVFDRELELAIADAPGAAWKIYWDVDAPATLDDMQADPAHHLRAVIPRYEMVLTYGGGDPVVDAYNAFGARDCLPIYNALDPAHHFPVTPLPDFASDLGFLGNRLPDREIRVDRFFLDAACALPSRRFLLGGSGWETKELPSNVRHIGHVGTAQHNAFFCSGLATLNVNRDSMARYGFSPPTRIFEAVGSGACLITDEWVGIELFLEPGREVLVAADGQAVAEHLQALTPSRAADLAGRARSRILAHHTYAHRARQVDRLLKMQSHRLGAAE
ncbi:glycosyltransferase [Tardiphaga sp.]|jgi:spore maturation protein CgeB|uniref:CgeB family protein n=1 Tax=Tardiphaga sp. TaxID=1926292 RepID=UPI0037D9D41D